MNVFTFFNTFSLIFTYWLRRCIYVGGAIECENLNKDSCAFAVSSSGKRCVLEKSVRRGGEEVYVCRASEIKADKVKDWVETDECVEACGLDRKALGISSDSLLESHFTQKLCSTKCYDGCPNVVDLYFNLAAGEGTILSPQVVLSQTKNRYSNHKSNEHWLNSTY